MSRPLTACVAIVVLLNFLAIVGSAQTVPPDTLKAAPDLTDEAYRQCVSGLRQLDAAVAALDSLIAVDADSRDEIALGPADAGRNSRRFPTAPIRCRQRPCSIWWPTLIARTGP